MLKGSALYFLGKSYSPTTARVRQFSYTSHLAKVSCQPYWAPVMSMAKSSPALVVTRRTVWPRHTLFRFLPSERIRHVGRSAFLTKTLISLIFECTPDKVTMT